MDTSQLNGKRKNKIKGTETARYLPEGGFVVVDPSPGDGTSVDIVAIPALGANPRMTWVPYDLVRSTENTKTQEEPSLWSRIFSKAFPPRSESSKPKTFSVQDREVEDSNRSHGPWLISELRRKIPEARVLLYDHGYMKDKDTLEILANRLLKKLSDARTSDLGFQDRHPGPRPIFFICHSTGGLVAKQALVEAHNRNLFTSIFEDSYGMTFLATPHQGSAYLSSRENKPSIQSVMNLYYDVPDSLQQQFRLGGDELQKLAGHFARCSTDLRINTYYETADSELTFTPANDNTLRSYQGFVTSISSAILDYEQESETALSSDHAGCAAFQGDDELRATFILELRKAVLSARDLSKIKHCGIEIENEVKIEVNGFFKNTTSSAQLWTSKPTLKDYLDQGSMALLQARMKQAKDAVKTSSTIIIGSEGQRPSQTTSRISESVNQIPNKVPEFVNKTVQIDALPAASRTSSKDGIQFSELQRHPRLILPSSIAPADPDPPLPAMKKLALTWIHVPYTHTGWVRDVLTRVSKDRETDLHSEFLKDEHWAAYHNRARHAAPHAKFVKSAFVDLSRSDGRPQMGRSGFAVYLQYLHWDTYRRLVERRAVITRRLEQARVRPIHESIKRAESIESKIIWKYIGAEPPFHCRRTLDQYGYPNLRSTKTRDDDQMLWKRTRPQAIVEPKISRVKDHKDDRDHQASAGVHSFRKLFRSFTGKQYKESILEVEPPAESSKLHNQGGNVLMVDQLWLWILDEHTVVTFFPKKEPMLSEGTLYQQANLHDEIYNEVNAGLPTVPDAETFACRILQRAVTILLDRTAHRHLQVLRIYEESISILTERMTRSYKLFRREGFSVRPDAYDRNKDGTPMTSDEKQERDLEVEKQSKGDFSSLLELRDVHDELHTLLKLFKEQNDTLTSMAKHYGGPTWPIEGQGTNVDPRSPDRQGFEAQTPVREGMQHLEDAYRKIKAFEANVKDMIDNAEKAEKAYSSLLDIKQKQANVDESRLARSQVDATAEQGRSIMVFTIFTIIFLPLSFFTSVFGMNVREWSDRALPLYQIVRLFGPISVGVIFFTLTLAFSNTIRSSATIARKVIVGIIYDLYPLVAWPLVKAYRISSAIYLLTPLSFLQKKISRRYLHDEEQSIGRDFDVWEDYATPLHKSSRDLANEKSRVLSSRRPSWTYKKKR